LDKSTTTDGADNRGLELVSVDEGRVTASKMKSVAKEVVKGLEGSVEGWPEQWGGGGQLSRGVSVIFSD